MKYIPLILLASLIGGCASVGALPKERIVVITKCPPIKYYSKEQLEKAALELVTLKDNSHIQGLVADYLKYRDACRVTNNNAKKKIRREQSKRKKKSNVRR